jgi:transcription initiation factor TFIIIB Brf1 subunit/transcription initiation factor TFIIB
MKWKLLKHNKSVDETQTVQTLHLKHYRSLKIKEKHNMDILSFILGMSIVVVIAVAVVAVMAFVKVRKHNKEIEDIHQIFSGEFERVRRDMTDMQRDIFSSLDSRLDKLESKLTTSRKA